MLCVWYTVLILYLNVVNAGFWPWKRAFLNSSVPSNETPDFYNLFFMSPGYSSSNGSCPAVDRGQAAAVQYGCFDISVAGIQSLHNQCSHFLSLHRDLHPSLVRSIFWMLVPRFTLSATASSETCAVTHAERCKLQTGWCYGPCKWSSRNSSVYTLRHGVQKGLSTRSL